MSHSLRFTATRKGSSRPSLDVTDQLDDETHARLVQRLRDAGESPEGLARESEQLQELFNRLAYMAGVSRAELNELYDFRLELK